MNIYEEVIEKIQQLPESVVIELNELLDFLLLKRDNNRWQQWQQFTNGIAIPPGDISDNLSPDANHQKQPEIASSPLPPKEPPPTPSREAQNLFQKGESVSNAGKYQEALDFYTRAIEIHPTYHQAWSGKGLAFRVLKHYNEAIECYNRALEIEPKFAKSWFGKGFAFYRLSHYNDALECYNRAIEIEPNDGSIWNGKGNALYSLNQYDEAIKCYTKALVLKPNDYVFWQNNGTSY